jgi:hypothetical protein
LYWIFKAELWIDWTAHNGFFASRWVRSHPRFAGNVLGHGLLHKQFPNGAHMALLWNTP